MKYALVNNSKQEAVRSGERGICICCETEMVAHCGPVKINHWQHKSLEGCDKWYEKETEWHREWKNHFPREFQEVVKFNKYTGEKHIADIYNPNRNLTIEIQHSPIEQIEIKSREEFYKCMLWIVDLIPIRKNVILHKNIKDAFYEEIIMKWATEQDRKMKQLEKNGKYDEVEKFRERNWEAEYIDWFEEKFYSYTDKDDYFLMQWKYQHKRWNTTTTPLFFDLGDEYIYMNKETIKIWNGFLVKRFLKSSFIKKYQS